ncbi:MAG: isoleucine--tRNA ligase, partial [Methyloligellaceae bacterium]
AEAEVEYHDYESDTIWVKFPVTKVLPTGDEKIRRKYENTSIVIWTTTPWTIPGNRAICNSFQIDYGIYEVKEAPEDNWAKVGDKLILADARADDVKNAARIETLEKVDTCIPLDLLHLVCSHPLSRLGYDFEVPVLEGVHVTDQEGTGFVHTAPGHGRDDFDIWMENAPQLEKRGITTAIPFTVEGDGAFTRDAPGFEGKQVITDKGKKGDANQAVIAALAEAGALIARGRLKHQYPHSWRSKKPVIFRNTPQWFIAIDAPAKIEGVRGKKTIRELALKAIGKTRWVPEQSRNRIKAMIEGRPDWVISRQRAWGVPITVFRHKETGDVLPNPAFEGSEKLIKRIVKAFEKEGADAWFDDGAKARFLKGFVKPKQLDDWQQVTDILDVWFDSGSTHSYVLEDRKELTWPADLYLEGTDQHRGWFHSSLLESCGTRGRAPYNAVLTHGFTLSEDGHKMSKSRGNDVAPQDVIKQSGADILRLWVASSDYSEDLRIGPEILKTNIDSYRKLRNTLRFLLGNLYHYEPSLRVAPKDMPELERYMLHRLHELDRIVRKGYKDCDFKRICQALCNFATIDLSAVYVDIRKDALYCDAYDSPTRRAAMTLLDEFFSCLTGWMAPMLCFTMEEAWLERFPGDQTSIHLRDFPEVPRSWK